MSTFEKPDEETAAAVRSAMATPAHLRLSEGGVTVYVLVAYGKLDKNGELAGPAIKVHGVPAMARVKITSAKHRAAGLADFELMLDGDQWEGLDDDERAALVDHELTHIEVAEPQDGLVRPKLTMRHHDQEHGWFDAVAVRHGMKSQECQQAKRLVDDCGQYYFDLAAPAIQAMKPKKGAHKRLDS